MTRPVAEWVALYQAGQSLRAIGASYGCCHKTVLYTFRAHGIQTRDRSHGNHPPRQQPWTVDMCPDCGHDRRLNPRTGWCWHCSLGTTRTLTSEGASIR